MLYHEPKDVKKETGRNLLYVLGVIVFFLLAAYFTADGQTIRFHRYEKNPKIITKYHAYPMLYGRSSADIVAVNVMVDSLATDKEKVTVFAFYPNIVYDEIKITFEDGALAILPRSKIIQNYGEYVVSKDNYNQLSNKKFISISFGDSGECSEVRMGYFFCDFLNQ